MGGGIHMTHPQSRVKVEKVGLLLLQIVIVVGIDVPAHSMEDVEWYVM
jgi:3-polyprenyl-4-hydroxybenzoate decarboxylase